MNIVNNIIVGVFIILLAFLLITLGINLDKNNNKFKPIITKCPDYFKEGNELVKHNTASWYSCLNDKKLGCKVPKVWIHNDINDSNDIKCFYKNYLNNCNLTWDGITNDDSLKC